MSPELIKQQNHEFLRKHNIPINESLPSIEPVSDLSPRSAEDVATRVVILSYVVGVGYGESGAQLTKALEKYDLSRATSAEEQRLLAAPKVTDQEKMDATWFAECIQAMVWCLGSFELDPFRDRDFDLSHLPDPFTDPSRYIKSAALRSFDELYQQADLYYRLHWAAVDCRLKGVPSPVDEDVIRERRKALEWVIGVEADWDDVPLDT